MRDAGLFQHAYPGGYIHEAHEGRQDRFPAAALRRMVQGAALRRMARGAARLLRHYAGDLLDVRHRLRSEHDDRPVCARIPQHRPQRRLIPVVLRIAHHVDRIVDRGLSGQRQPQRLFCALGKSGQFQALAHGRIGRHNPWSAGIGDDRDPPA